MKAEMIAVGSEMLTPFRLDTNSLFLTEELNRLGIEVSRKVVVGDDREQLQAAFREALEHAELVLVIGGLGPTEDDVTREALAELLGRELHRDEDVLRAIQARFRRFGRPMPESNVRQAMVPAGAEVLPNSRGTAPGLWLEESGRLIVLLPGPPHECKGLYEDEVKLRLEKRAPRRRLYSREIRIAGMGESAVDQSVAPIYKAYPDVETTILAAPGEVQLHLRCWSEDEEAARKLLHELTERICFALGDAVYSTDGQTLEQVVAARLQQQRATLALAESCTGGMVAERLTAIPGSSAYLLGGIVCYSNEIKSGWLDVPAELIEAKGAVSAEVTAALAENVRRRSGATLGLAVTGIAGPGGGTPEKPAGTVFLALANGTATRERALQLPGDRERVRFQASQAALDMIRRYFLRAQAHR